MVEASTDEDAQRFAQQIADVVEDKMGLDPSPFISTSTLVITSLTSIFSSTRYLSVTLTLISRVEENIDVKEVMTKVEVEMNGEGRILVRPSGTEQVFICETNSLNDLPDILTIAASCTPVNNPSPVVL
jgi:phosphomannomutase